MREVRQFEQSALVNSGDLGSNPAQVRVHGQWQNIRKKFWTCILDA